MADNDWSAFGFTEAEADALSAQFLSYCERFGPDNCDDAFQDAWVKVLAVSLSPPPDYPEDRPAQLRYLKRCGENAACDFENRFAYDAPMGKAPNGSVRTQTHRMTDIPSE